MGKAAPSVIITHRGPRLGLLLAREPVKAVQGRRRGRVRRSPSSLLPKPHGGGDARQTPKPDWDITFWRGGREGGGRGMPPHKKIWIRNSFSNIVCGWDRSGLRDPLGRVPPLRRSPPAFLGEEDGGGAEEEGRRDLGGLQQPVDGPQTRLRRRGGRWWQ